MPQSGGVARWIGRLRYHVVCAMMARTPPASLVNVNGKLYGTTFYGGGNCSQVAVAERRRCGSITKA